MSKQMILEVGNSSLKFFDCQSGRIERALWRSVDLSAELEKYTNQYSEWMLFGTHRVMTEKVHGILRSSKVSVVRPRKLQTLLNTTYAISELGIDRYLGLLGAYRYLDTNQIKCKNMCVIGAGTAWTIDLADKLDDRTSFRHCGGTIALSPRFTLEALAQKTGALPDCSLEVDDWHWVNTSDSWASTKGAIAGAIKAQTTGLFKKVLGTFDAKLCILLHGGGAKLAAKVLGCLGYESVIVQELIFIGARNLWHNREVGLF